MLVEFANELPVVALLDPRTLWASQPAVTRAGVEYYLSPTWFRTGRTYADQHSRFNRLPVVERRRDGTDVILNGYHRSCATLLQGTLVLARCILLREPIDGSRTDLWLPSLAVGSWADATSARAVEEAVAMIESGTRVHVESPQVATEVVRLLGSQPWSQPLNEVSGGSTFDNCF